MASDYGYQPGGGFNPGYGGGSDINSIRNRLAMAQLQAGMSTDPIRSPWQGAARLSDALFGALRLQQAGAQGAAGASANADVAAKLLAALTAANGGAVGAGGAAGAGLPAQPGALSDLANDPDIMRGVANATTNGLPDSATIGASMQMGAYPPQMGPSQPPLIPNNSAGGGTGSGSMSASLAPRLDPRMMVAGPGAPSLPPSGPASEQSNGPELNQST
jgi:hypothetical protein